MVEATRNCSFSQHEVFGLTWQDWGDACDCLDWHGVVWGWEGKVTLRGLALGKRMAWGMMGGGRREVSFLRQIDKAHVVWYN